MRTGRIVCSLVLLTLACSCSFAAQTLFSGDEAIPAYATVLFNGQDLSNWTNRGGDKPAGWKVENGYMQVNPGSGDIVTKQKFTDYQLHIELWLPNMGDAQGQARANSGIYMQGRYELQVLDSYRLDSKNNDCGAIYSIAAPMVNACRPPEHWQSFDILFHAPKFDTAGKKTANARISVLQNGVWIHDNVEIPDTTGSAIDGNVSQPGPILLQDHSNLIRYRNIWIRPL